VILLDHCRPGGLHCPRITATLDGIGGALTGQPEDFVVDEVPAYAPSGVGDHIFVKIKKRGLTTPDMVRKMARAAHCSERDIGVAGRKDKHAVTTQWISMPVMPHPPDDDRIEILEAHPHGHKLRRGHLQGNRFTVRIDGIVENAHERLSPLLDCLSQGVPNYYGPQRFGYGDDGVQRALASLKSRGRRGAQTFAASVVQSALFNLWLGHRIRDDLFHSVVPGDILKKRESGGLFTSDDPLTDQARMDAGELVATGPMYGPKMRNPTARAHERETDICALSALHEDDWARMGRHGKGSRRVSRVFPEGLDTRIDGRSLWLSFSLPAGAYATVLIDELTH